ncbi:MAG: DUF177 domain-containing protein [Deltaproteobacteria bacterium]
MNIRFDEIPEEGLRLHIEEESWFPDREVDRRGGVAADVFLQKREQRVFVEGSVATSVRLSCDRCLESFCTPLASTFKIDIELVDKLPARESEHFCSGEEMDMMFVAAPAIDIFQVLAQQIFIALPVKKLCSENCAGLCSRCGANLNVEPCGCAEEKKPSPFEVLNSLKH